MLEKFDIQTHLLVPKHAKFAEKEVEKLLEKYNVTISQLPKILKTDPVAKELNAKPGEVIKIVRNSPTVGISEFFRVIVDE